MSESAATAQPQASDGSVISTPAALMDDTATGTPKKTKSTQGTDKSADIQGQIEAAIAAGDFKTALALGAGAEGIPAALMTQAQQGLEAQQGLAAAAATTATPDGAAPGAPKPDGQQPQISVQKELAPPPAVELEPKLNTTELEKKAVKSNPQIIEVGLKSGAAYGEIAEAAALKKITGKGAAMASTGKDVSDIVSELATEVGSQLSKLVKQGSFGVLWNGTAEKLSTSSSNLVDLNGTGKMELGNLPPPSMALADTNVIAANKDAPAIGTA